ncbi:MAG: hypothetical protein MUF00_10820 [Gemmatimonadaceae bacterium]|jgi:hypothetical protein|nr:hypothetical protein [Gemmatimonadaceae bacterium]
MSSLHSDLDFIASICGSFADAINETGSGLSGQDAYEVLTTVFGDTFSEDDLRKAGSRHHEALAEHLRSVLDVANATPELAKSALERALQLWRSA